MRLKSIFMLILTLGLHHKIGAQAHRLSPPKTSDDNGILLNTAVSSHKSIYTGINEITIQAQKLKEVCEKEINDKTLICGNPCFGGGLDDLKARTLHCMNTFLKLETPINRNRLEIAKLKYSLSSGLYDDMSGFRDALLNKLNTLSEDLKNIDKYVENIADGFGKQNTTLLNSEFAQAKVAGILAGTIKATCLHLKRALEGQQIAFSIRNTIKSYVYWRQFLDTVTGYQLVSNALIDNCPDDMKPADYSPLVNQVRLHLESIEDTNWAKLECSKPAAKEYLGDKCEGDFMVNSYMVSILGQVSK